MTYHVNEIKIFARCLYCTNYYYAKNTTREKKHLRECQPYLKASAQSSQQARQGEHVLATMGRRGMEPFSKEEKKEVDLLAAMSIYRSAMPFSTLSNPAMLRFLQQLDPSYAPPGRRALSEGLLDETYSRVRARVMAVIDKQEFINVIMDESDDITHHRIINLSVLTDCGAFHFKTEDYGSGRMTAANLSQWALDNITTVVNGEWHQVNSFISDTCSTMRAVWDILSKKECMKHVFFIPCDSHGLQLLIQDILTQPPYENTLKNAQLVVTSFHSSRLQLSFLREHQLRVYSKHKSLIMSVITRWGTQFALL